MRRRRRLDGDLPAAQVAALGVGDRHPHVEADGLEGARELGAAVEQVDERRQDHVPRGPAFGLEQQFARHGAVIPDCGRAVKRPA